MIIKCIQLILRLFFAYFFSLSVSVNHCGALFIHCAVQSHSMFAFLVCVLHRVPHFRLRAPFPIRCGRKAACCKNYSFRTTIEFFVILDFIWFLLAWSLVNIAVELKCALCFFIDLLRRLWRFLIFNRLFAACTSIVGLLQRIVFPSVCFCVYTFQLYMRDILAIYQLNWNQSIWLRLRYSCSLKPKTQSA